MQPERVASSRHRQQTVLIVEVDPVQRLQAVRLAESLGIVALEATHADRAVAVLNKRPEVTLLFMSADAPGQSSPADLARRAAARWPSIQIVVASGTLPEVELRLPAGCRFIVKPFYSKDLAAALKPPVPAEAVVN